jgi:hypothetical protein
MCGVRARGKQAGRFTSPRFASLSPALAPLHSTPPKHIHTLSCSFVLLPLLAPLQAGSSAKKTDTNFFVLLSA